MTQRWRESSGEELIVEGMLIGGDDERVDLVVTPYVLSLEREAILEIESLPDPPGLVAETGHAVRVRLVIGARLFWLSSSAEVEARMWRRRTSFAVACRPEPADQTEETPYQRAATRDFLASHGIEGPP